MEIVDKLMRYRPKRNWIGYINVIPGHIEIPDMVLRTIPE
jgi:hypothetical protein